MHFPSYPARLKLGDRLTGVVDLRSLVASKARLNAALRRQRPSRLHCTNGAPLTLLAIQWFRNAPFHDLLFGVNEIRLEGKTGFCPRDTCLAAFVQPRESHGQRRNFGTSTESAFFFPVLIETIHTCASFIDSDSLMARATCNCGRVRREHFGKWPPGRQESCGSRSPAGRKTVFLRPKSR